MAHLPLTRDRMAKRLARLYGAEQGKRTAERLFERLGRTVPIEASGRYDETTVFAIAYGDHVQRAGEASLETVRSMLEQTYGTLLSHVHILPFYPYTSDDGFSVVDYRAVDPALGTWDDIRRFSRSYGLMFDYVLNHISSQSEWFKRYQAGDPDYQDFFISVSSDDSRLSLVRRPRPLPLLTPFPTSEGIRHIWTTFSADQIDLNYRSPDVLLAMIDVLLYYVEQGAQYIRMDAMTYLWKELGTECANLPQTHEIARLFRDVLTEVAPHVRIITETNVPHDENISYFGDGHDEAHGVYNFALPPLLLHTLQTGDKTAIEAWLNTLDVSSDDTFFFNFTSSHDGIGVQPAKGLLPPEEIARMIARVEQNGGLVSYKTTADGGSEPYELNATYFDALATPGQSEQVTLQKFIISQSVVLALKGIPAIYFGCLVGNRNWAEGVENLGHNRAINRQKLRLGADLSLDELEDPGSLRGQVVVAYRTMLRARQSSPVFSPVAAMRVPDLAPEVLAIERQAGGETVVALHNLSDTDVRIALDQGSTDLLTGRSLARTIMMTPYQVIWVKLHSHLTHIVGGDYHSGY